MKVYNSDGELKIADENAVAAVDAHIADVTSVHDHGSLSGLADNDHPQYTTDAEASVIAAALDHAPVTVGTGLDVTGQLVELDLSEVAAGGELGGNMDAPTVDATHSGSAHHAAATEGVGIDIAGQVITVDLSEISAGGELGGTMDAPTVDATHSGSAHHTPESSWPVGSVYISVVSTNPNTLFGFGTWAAFATGRMLVGINSGDVSFDVVEETGGAKTHSHTYTTGHTHTAGTLGVNGTAAVAGGGSSATVGGANVAGAGHTHGAGSLGVAGGASGSTVNPDTDTAVGLPPYIVVYMWKRTA